MQNYQFIVSVNLLQLFGHLQCPIWASVVNNNDLVVMSAVKINIKTIFIEQTQGQTRSCTQRVVINNEDRSTELPELTFRRNISPKATQSKADFLFRCKLVRGLSICPHCPDIEDSSDCSLFRQKCLKCA